MELQEVFSNIASTRNQELESRIVAHLNDLTKPPKSLGVLEDIALRYCLCKSNDAAALNSMKVFTFAGDHGITEEGITPYPSEVTFQMVMNMASGGAAVSVMCESAQIEYHVVNMGVKADFPNHDRLIKASVGKGTKNFSIGPAMTKIECENAIIAGYTLGKELTCDIVGVGEMGIGNSSSASALYSLMLNKTVSETTGAGTGSVGSLYDKKVKVIEKALNLHKNQWDGSGFDALCRVGGFEIAGMVGFIFGCAQKAIPVVIDGFIASASALVALHINKQIADWLFFSHQSQEKFHKSFLKEKEIRPLLSLDLRLGEGTGSVLALQIIQQAMACYSKMATFSSAGVSNKSE